MTWRIRQGWFLGLAVLCASTAAWPRDTAWLSARCTRYADLDACADVVRWRPSDPPLLAAFGNALMRAHRPADALRQYRRAAALAPNMPGIGAKIRVAEARLRSRRPLLDARRNAPPAPRAPAPVVRVPAIAPAPAPVVRAPASAPVVSAPVALPAPAPAPVVRAPVAAPAPAPTSVVSAPVARAPVSAPTSVLSAPVQPSVVAAADQDAGTRYSNTAPEAQSH
ncbi:MAG: hypothetical protein ABSH33_08635 [Steroidobacteraceae bacterium]|jgi:hypothetical protein